MRMTKKMKTSSSNDEEKKTTSEKPISLSPLGFKETLEALLKVKLKEKIDYKK